MKFVFKFDETALHAAVDKCNLEIVQLLLNQQGFDINLKNVFLNQFL